MNPIAALLCCRLTPAVPLRTAPHRGPSADDGQAEPAAGCGWYDSSSDLRIGLVVSEHATVDPLSADLPLVEWIELRLQGWCPPQELPPA